MANFGLVVAVVGNFEESLGQYKIFLPFSLFLSLGLFLLSLPPSSSLKKLTGVPFLLRLLKYAYNAISHIAKKRRKRRSWLHFHTYFCCVTMSMTHLSAFTSSSIKTDWNNPGWQHKAVLYWDSHYEIAHIESFLKKHINFFLALLALKCLRYCFIGFLASKHIEPLQL